MNKAMHFNALIVTAGLVAASVNATARAAVNIDATFSPGASLDNFGFAPLGSPPPNAQVSGGAWNANLGAGEVSYWTQPALVDQFSSNIVHGLYEITASTFSNFFDDVTLVRLSTDNPIGAGGYLGRLAIASGQMNVQTYQNVLAPAFSVPVVNTDNAEHVYGWELNRTTGNFKIFFDGAQVGDPAGYALGNNTQDPSNSFYLGDGTGGEAHVETWDRVVFAEGAFPVVPEPASLGLLAAGGLLMIRRRRCS